MQANETKKKIEIKINKIKIIPMLNKKRFPETEGEKSNGNVTQRLEPHAPTMGCGG